MTLFQSEQEVYDVLGTFFRESAEDESIGPEIRNSGLVIQFEYSHPDSILTIDARNPPEGGCYGVYEGHTEVEPDVRLEMKADVANEFWLGKLNLLVALTRRQIVATGPMPKLMKLLPAVQPAYEKYRAYLKELGREDLLQG